VTLAPTAVSVAVLSIDNQDYDVDSWDEHGLMASHGWKWFDSPSQRHVLTVNFASSAVSMADIPTHQKSCNAFTDTNAYRLVDVDGFYYIDTTPKNDADKPYSK
jgi:hypothetical protein